MKQIILTFFLLCAAASVRAQAEADYTDWFFVQGDKALQYRFAEAKKEGTVSYLQMQFRVNSNDEVDCKGVQCDGYVLSMNHDNIARTATVRYHLYFAPSFTGSKIYSFAELVPIELKTWEDGSKRYIDKKRGILVSYPDGGWERAMYFDNCVDFKLKNEPKTRCTDYDAAKAVRVTESNVTETDAPAPEKKPSR